MGIVITKRFVEVGKTELTPTEKRSLAIIRQWNLPQRLLFVVWVSVIKFKQDAHSVFERPTPDQPD